MISLLQIERFWYSNPEVTANQTFSLYPDLEINLSNQKIAFKINDFEGYLKFW